MAIVGWLVVTLFFTFITAVWALTAWNTMGRYTIGGQTNSLLSKVFVLAVGAFLCICWWFLVVKAAPFTVTLT